MTLSKTSQAIQSLIFCMQFITYAKSTNQNPSILLTSTLIFPSSRTLDTQNPKALKHQIPASKPTRTESTHQGTPPIIVLLTFISSAIHKVWISTTRSIIKIIPATSYSYINFCLRNRQAPPPPPKKKRRRKSAQ